MQTKNRIILRSYQMMVAPLDASNAPKVGRTSSSIQSHFVHHFETDESFQRDALTGERLD